jgi:hypothetical protein
MHYWLQQLQAWYFANEKIWQILGILSIFFFIGTLITVPLIIINLPQRYLVEDRFSRPTSRQTTYSLYILLKNILGGLFIIAGVVMLILPGQRLLTLAIGFMLINLPCKRTLVLQIIRRQGVRTMINLLRAKAAKPPLEVPDK